MEKISIIKKSQKTSQGSADKKILLFRRGIRYYPYNRKGKALPACS